MGFAWALSALHRRCKNVEDHAKTLALVAIVSLSLTRTAAQPVELVVRENGTNELHGKSVRADQLASELTLLSTVGPLQLQLSASSRAHHQAVEAAVTAVQEAGTRHFTFRTLE